MASTPVVGYSSTDQMFNDKTKYLQFLRTVDDDRRQALVVADLINHFDWSHIMGLYGGGNVHLDTT